MIYCIIFRDSWQAVSSHVPARGTPHFISFCGYFIPVSIHVPARGTTVQGGSQTRQNAPVSIHVPARGTTRRRRQADTAQIVSIHVPARGTTTVKRPVCTAQHSFNPRSREGNDFSPFTVTYPPKVFQSTFPRGERQAYLPRVRPVYGVSIHVPARGTTPPL